MLLKKNIPFSYILGKIKAEILLVTVYTAAVAVAYKAFHFTHLVIPLSIPMIMGTVISLLLAFRSNQAYDRWWEARTIWGAIVNDSRSLARQINSFVSDVSGSSEGVYFRSRFIKRQIAWCYSLSRSLRGQEAMNGNEKYLSRSDQQSLKTFMHIPSGILNLQGLDLQKALQEKWINSYQQVELDRTLSKMSDAMGKCERIKNTVFPVTYSLYIHFSLIFFFLLLPFAVVDFFGYMCIPVVVAIASVFFLIEKMAIHLQDPFENKPTDTPMTAICFTIERDLKQMMSESAAPVATISEVEQRVRLYYIL